MEERGCIEIKELEKFGTKKGGLANLIGIIHSAMWNGKKITIGFKKEQRGVTCGIVSWKIVKEK